MNPHLTELGRLARAELARRTLGGFCHQMDPNYVYAKHVSALVAHLEALERRDIQKLAVFMPPRHGKTYHVSERFPAWYLGRNARKHVILASYAAELAEANSRKARGLVSDDRWPFPGVKVSEESAAVNRWHTSEGGGCIAAGVGGGLTGFGAHLLIIDDPVKDRASADSEAQRNLAWNWYTDVARTRLMPGGVQLLAQTRWHEDDLAGRLLNSPGSSEWTILTLPAVAMEDDQLGRQMGEALWPGAFPVEALPSVTKGEISKRAFEALYQQNPLPDSGLIFKREWFSRRYRDLPQLRSVIQAVDSAWKTGVANDYSAIATWGTDGIDYYLIDVWRGRAEFPRLRQIVAEQFAKHKPSAVLVEEAASGLAIIAEMKANSGLPIIAVNVKGAKESRAEAVTPLFESGKVQLPEGQPWLDEWIAEHLRFPGGAHDDMVDTTSLALKRLRTSGPRLIFGVIDCNGRRKSRPVRVV